jgi:hypothetical protein
MIQVRERVQTRTPMSRPTEAPSVVPSTRRGTIVRVLGALALLGMGVVHLEQFFAVHYRVVPAIGPLFALNFAGATVLALLLVSPLGRSRSLGPLLALGGMAMALASIVFLLISENRQLFGFMEYGYRPAIILALASEAAATVLLGAYLGLQVRRR